MGTTVVYIPQNSGVPAQFFLYPTSCRERLIKALQEIARESRVFGKRQRKQKREDWNFWKAVRL